MNKIVWSGLGWDPRRRMMDILRHYSRYFIGDRYTGSSRRDCWRWSATGAGRSPRTERLATLQQFQDMERAATPRELRNWRFQQALYRAYYDAYSAAG